MFRTLIFYSLLISSTFTAALVSADSWTNNCYDYQTLEIGTGWRRDNLDWKVSNLRGGHSKETDVDSHIHLNDIDMYELKGRLKFLGSHYYVRLTGSYAISYKGRAKEQFDIDNSCLFSRDKYSIHTSNHIKRQSEFYDFNLAVGYPFLYLDCHLSVIPTIGYAYDRQRLKVNQKHDHSSSSFSLDSSSNVFCSDLSSNPFSSSDSSEIASKLGIENHHDSANYRFSWYGPFIGMDMIYTVDNCWTLYAEFQGHFLNQVHRKRRSHTGVTFVDNYHHSGSAYGFDGSFGTCFNVCEDWYCVINVDYKWWRGDSKHDKLEWDSIGINASLGYVF